MENRVVPLSVSWVVASFIIYKLSQFYIRRRKYAAQASNLGCQETPTYPDAASFLGLKHLRELQKSDEDQQFPNYVIHRQDVMSKIHGRVCSTFKFNVLGQTVYFTSDPENLKTILATKFSDFDLGPARRGNMSRTLGDGIVSLSPRPER